MGYWRRELIEEILGEEMVNIIYNIPFSKMGLDDRLIWEATINGKFTVKSVYYLELKRKRREKGPQVASLRKVYGEKYGI